MPLPTNTNICKPQIFSLFATSLPAKINRPDAIMIYAYIYIYTYTHLNYIDIPKYNHITIIYLLLSEYGC